MRKIIDILLFLLVFGLFSALLRSSNFLLVPLVGYGVITTTLLTDLVTMYLFILSYRHAFKMDVEIVRAFIYALPIYLITFLIEEYFSHFGSTVVYTDFGRQELAKEILLKALGYSAFLSFIFVPLNRLAKRKYAESKK